MFSIKTRKHQFILLILSTQGLQIPSEVIRGKRLKNRSKIATFCKIWYIRKWRKNCQLKPVISILPANLSGNSSLAKLEDETEAKTMQIWKKLFMVWQKIFFWGFTHSWWSFVFPTILCPKPSLVSVCNSWISPLSLDQGLSKASRAASGSLFRKVVTSKVEEKAFFS